MGCPVRATMDVVQVGEALGLPDLARPLRGGGRLDRRDQPGQASHRIHGRHRLRPPQDDDDRHGQAPRRRPGPPGEHPPRVRADDHRARRRHAPERPHRVRARGRRERLRRDGAVEAFLPGELEAGERELLRKARAWMAKLPFDAIDLLIVDEIGKEISGTGMDTNVIGRHATWFERPFTTPADHVHPGVRRDGEHLRQRQRDRPGRLHDPPAGRQDRLGADLRQRAHGVLARAGRKLPAVLDSAQEAIAVALSCLGLDRPEDARVVRIQNTLRLTEVEVSEALHRRAPRPRRPRARRRPRPNDLRPRRRPPAVLRGSGFDFLDIFVRRRGRDCMEVKV